MYDNEARISDDVMPCISPETTIIVIVLLNAEIDVLQREVYGILGHNIKKLARLFGI